jgi:hypothetical protein
MKRLRGLLVHSPSLAISMLALVFALGSGAGYAASTTVSRAPGSHGPALIFHKLKLGKGWRGDLRYVYRDGIVYLTGSASGRHAKTQIMATLPKSLAPTARQLDIPINFGQASDDGLLIVDFRGDVVPYAPNGTSYSYVSLSGVSFPAGAP